MNQIIYCPNCGDFHEIYIISHSEEMLYCNIRIIEQECVCHRCGTKFDVKREIDAFDPYWSYISNKYNKNYYQEELLQKISELKEELRKKEALIENFKARLEQYSNAIRKEGQSFIDDIIKIANEYEGETNE